MELSRALLKDFAKAINNSSEKSKTSSVNLNGTAVVDKNGKKFVQIDGSEQITPISELTDVQNGDRVLVSIENHQAIVLGNYTYPPSARTANSALAAAESAITEFTAVKADMITTDTLSAKLVEVGYITAEQANIAYGKITELESVAITTNNFEAKAAEINLLTVDQANANYLTATQADLKYATIDELNAKTVTAEEIQAAIAEVGYLKAEDITAVNGEFNYLDSKVLDSNYASFQYLEANYATIEQLEAKTVTAEEIQAAVAEVGYLTSTEADLKYANIELSNVEVESVGTLFARIGILEDMTVTNGYVTGVLNGVRINADVITAGTLSVDRLMVTGEDSIVYQINVASSGLTLAELADEKYQKYLNGTDIVAGSITADRIAAGTITSNEIASGAITTDNLAALAVTAAKIDTVDLFAQDITATGTIRGVNLIGAHGSFSGDITATEGFIGGWNILSTMLYNDVIDVEGNIYTTVLQNVSNVIYLTEFYSTCSEITPSVSEFSYAVKVEPTATCVYGDVLYVFSVKIPTDRLIHGTEYTIYIYDGYNKVEGKTAVYSVGKDSVSTDTGTDNDTEEDSSTDTGDGFITLPDESLDPTIEFDAPGDTGSTTAKLNKYVKFTYDENCTNYRLSVGLKDMTEGASYDFIFSIGNVSVTGDIVVSDGLDPNTVLGIKYEDVDGNITTPFYLLRDGTMYTESGLTVKDGIIRFIGANDNTWKIDGPSSILRFHRNDIVKFQMGADGSFYAAGSVWAEGGYLYSTSNGNTLTIGSQNSAWCHFNNSADIPFYFNKPIISNSRDGNWVSGMTITRAAFGVNTKASGDAYFPVIAMETQSGHVWNIGTYVDQVGFYGYKSGRTENGYDWATYWNVSTGTMNVSGAATFGSNVTSSGFKVGSTTYGSGTVELYGSWPFIDFHFNNSTDDYTSRIIENASGRLAIPGKLSVGGYTNDSATLATSSLISNNSIQIINTTAVEVNYRLKNSAKNATFVLTGDGRYGIWDASLSKWQMEINSAGSAIHMRSYTLVYNQLQLYAANYGVMLRNDNNAFYILLTNSGNAQNTTAWNSLRPFTVTLSSGAVGIATAVTMGSTLSVSGAFTASGSVKLGNQSASSAVYLSNVCLTTSNGNFRPGAVGDGTALLGTSDYRWSWVYSSHGSLTTSDEREKNILGYLDEDKRYKEFFMKLRPIKYRWKTNVDDGRIQIGLGAQTSEQMMYESDLSMDEFAGIMFDELETQSSLGYWDRYSICYQQFDTLTMLVTQDNARAIESLELWKNSVDYQLDQAREQIANQQIEITELKNEIATLKAQVA